MADQSNIQSAASKSIRPFKSSEEYLYAMKEDLAEWLNTLYELELNADTFMEGLETGCALCRHANHVNRAARDFQLEYPEAARSMNLPSKDVVFQSRNVIPGSFLARDNVSNFISWCRQELWIKDVLMFETNDLVERCNEKNFVLCLLEVARRGAKFGMLAPMLIQLEEEIEEEIRDQECVKMEAEIESPESKCVSREESNRGPKEKQAEEEPIVWPQKRVLCDMRNLDELVREILGRCNCPAQFPMIKVSEGKYKVGDSSALIFIRVLRTHVMVRVGGGWDTLEHYLDKHDPCRCSAFAHRYHQAKASGQGQGQGAHSKSSSAQSSRSTSPGPHWKNETISTCKPSSSPSCTGSSPSRSSEVDGPAHNLLPRPPRDCSEPRHLNRFRNKESVPLTRRLSGDSDSSTASSKGGGGPYTRRSGEEVILMVNRKEGRHVIERPGATNPVKNLRQSPRARSQSREHTLKSSSPTTVNSSTEGRSERGRSLGTDSPRKFHVSRSHSQGKLTGRTRASDASPGPASRLKDPQKEDLRAKQITPTFTRTTKRQPAGTNSSTKPSSFNTPSKKTVMVPRPPVTGSPSLSKGHVLPLLSSGRRSPHSSPNHHHHVTRPHRSTHGRGGLGQNVCVEEPSRALGFHILPPLDPQKEQDLYRSFEAEFLENSRHAMGGARAHLKPSSDVTDSAYSSSNSSSSSLNVGTKAGSLPDLKDTRRTHRQFPVDDPLNLLYGNVGADGLAPGEAELWVGRGLRTLPAITSSTEIALTSDVSSHRGDCLLNHGSFQSQSSNLNGGCVESLAGDQTLEDVPCRSQPVDLPLGENGSEDLPPPSEDQDSSSESSSMCFSLSESHSPPRPHGPVLLNGVSDSSRKDIHKHKLRARVRPRTDPRPSHSPSRIPTPVNYRSPCHTPVSYRSPSHTPVSYRSPCHTPVSYRSPCHTPVSYRSPCHTPPLSPSCKSLHQAFTEMIHPQQCSPAMGTKDCHFPGQSGSLDTEAWM